MNILFYLCLVFAVSLALAKIPDEEMKTRQFMTDSDEGHNNGVEYEGEESDEDAFGVEPTKHPYKVRYRYKFPLMIFETWNIYVVRYCSILYCSLLLVSKRYSVS